MKEASAMKRTAVWIALMLGMAASQAPADTQPAEIKLRKTEFKGMMNVQSALSLTVTFDVKKENLYDDLKFDFYILLEPHDKELGPLFFHCRTVHRFLREDTGYESEVSLGSDIMQCIKPRDAKYAVVATYRGEEVGLENSEKERWWEQQDLGKPIENVLSRSSGAPVVREWESTN